MNKRNPSHVQQQIEVNKILNEQYGGHQQISHWLKEALRVSIYHRDILDAYADACLLQAFLKKRVDAVLNSAFESTKED